MKMSRSPLRNARGVAIGGIAVSMMFALLAACSDSDEPTGGGQKVVLKMAVTQQPTDPMWTAVERFGKLMEERTDGRISIEPLQGAQLGGEPEELEAVKNGTVQMGEVGFTGNPQLEALMIPYLFPTADQQKAVVESKLGKTWVEGFEKQANVKWIGFAFQNARQLTTTDRSVEEPADVKDLKIRVPAFEPLVLAWKALGASPESMSISDVFFALQQGVIQAQENPMEQIIGNSFHEVQKYLVLLNYSRPIMNVFVNERVWDSLSKDEQETMVKTWNEVRDWHQKLNSSLESENIDKAKAAGMKVIDNPDIEAFKTKTAEPMRDYAEKVWGKDGYQEVLSIVAAN